MKKVIAVLLSVLLLSSCTPIPKFELPTSGTPPIVIYKRNPSAKANKSSNYDLVMAKFKEICPDSKLVLDDKLNCYFQMIGYYPYKYKGKEHKFSFLFSFQGENRKCELTINQIKILHYNIERMYLDEKRKTIKAFNPSFEEINNKINSTLDELEKQVK